MGVRGVRAKAAGPYAKPNKRRRVLLPAPQTAAATPARATSSTRGLRCRPRTRPRWPPSWPPTQTATSEGGISSWPACFWAARVLVETTHACHGASAGLVALCAAVRPRLSARRRPPPTPPPCRQRTLADLVLDKIRERQAEQGVAEVPRCGCLLVPAAALSPARVRRSLRAASCCPNCCGVGPLA